MTILQASRPALGLAQIQTFAAPDMAAVDTLIRARLASDVVLINQIADHIISAGGKRLRPMLVMLAGRAVGGSGPAHHQLAAIIEFIHTSTLLHDDVVDESDLRRGRSTANALWGNAPSVLVGDFLYSRSFQLMVELDQMPVMRILADTTNKIAEGEVLQLLHVHNPDTDEAAYLRVIERMADAGGEHGHLVADQPDVAAPFGVDGERRGAPDRGDEQVAARHLQDRLAHRTGAQQVRRAAGQADQPGRRRRRAPAG